MCGRFSLILYPDELFCEERVKVVFKEQWQPRYNIAPSEKIVVLRRQDNEVAASLMHWGMPLQALFPRLPNKLLINAKVETVSKNKVYRDLLGQGRLVVPADSFYEWTVEQKKSVPHRIMRVDGRPLFIGGFSAAIGDKLSVALLTEAAAPELLSLHDRMPLLLDEAAALRWLEPSVELPILKGVSLPLQHYRVDSWVNTAGNEGIKCHERVLPLPDLFK